MVDVEQWAEIRRLSRVEQLSVREISRRTGLHRKTVRRALTAEVPPTYSRSLTGSKLDPFKDWICEQLQADPGIQSQRLRELASELGYAGGKSIFDDYVREVRPGFVVPRTFQQTIYRPGELVQCDLWEPRQHVAVGHGQTRRGWVVTCEACWSRTIAGTLIFSKQAPDILWGLARNLRLLGALPEKLVWDREAAIGAGGRPTEPFAAFCGQLEVGDGRHAAIVRRHSVKIRRPVTVRTRAVARALPQPYGVSVCFKGGPARFRSHEFRAVSRSRWAGAAASAWTRPRTQAAVDARLPERRRCRSRACRGLCV